MATPTGIEYGNALRADIAGAIRRHRPEIVITMSFDLTWGGVSVNHADHRVVGLATLDACRDAANRWLLPEHGQPWQRRAGRVRERRRRDHPLRRRHRHHRARRGVAPEHQAYIDGLGTDFDADAFLRSSAEGLGADVGCTYAIGFRRYEV